MYANLTIKARFCLKGSEGKKNKQRRWLLVIQKHQVCPAQLIPAVSAAAWAVANEMLMVYSFAPCSGTDLTLIWAGSNAIGCTDFLWKAFLATPAIRSNSWAITVITSGSFYLKDICKHFLLLIVTGAVLITAAGMASAHPCSLNWITAMAATQKGGNGGSGFCPTLSPA